MSCGAPLCILKPVLIVAALAGVGMAGYNLTTKGCPLGSCLTPENASATLTSQAPAGVCPVTGRCLSESGATLISAAAAESENSAACDGSSCSAEMKAACEQLGACPMGSEHCKPGDEGGACPVGASDCQQACPEAALAGPVADSEQTTETSEG